jgi:hypothetical protein
MKSDLGSGRPAGSRKLLWSRTAAVMGLTLLTGGLTGGCGNLITVVDAGQLGITVDAAGGPVIAVMSCARATPVISMAEGRRPSDPDDQENVERGSWRARTSFAGVRQLPISAPGENWTTIGEPGTLESDRLFIVNGGTVEDDDASLTPVDFRTSDLARLAPGRVLVAGKVESLEAFGAYRCR